jgi:DNA-nicking Smr family endonuclease
MRVRNRHRRLSQDEVALWRRVVASVTPLAAPEPAEPESLPSPTVRTAADPIKRVDRMLPAERLDLAELASALTTDRPLVSTGQPCPAPGSEQPFAADRRMLRKLRNRQLSIEGRLDLHGMTQAEAHAALLRFIVASRGFGRRTVLVVTGKGWKPDAGRPEDAVGVLRRHVPRWLETDPFTEHVAGIRDAHARHGGSGALYVVLRQSSRSRP